MPRVRHDAEAKIFARYGFQYLLELWVERGLAASETDRTRAEFIARTMQNPLQQLYGQKVYGFPIKSVLVAQAVAATEVTNIRQFDI
jgi:hypothetical protein